MVVGGDDEYDGWSEYAERDRRAEFDIKYLIEKGLFSRELDIAEYTQLRYAYHIIDELVRAFEDIEAGKYVKPGEAFYSLEIFGLYRCFYCYQKGVLIFNNLSNLKANDLPIVRLYINGKLLGLSILGKPVMNYYHEYLDWVNKLGSGLNFHFGG
jgi:hypothetical protein